MALSFNDSLKKMSNNTASHVAVQEQVMTASVPVVLSDDENWTTSNKYLWYSDYSDDELSEIDSVKNITVNQNQINLTQESNSQFIPFVMNRYYDGVDLMSMTLLIHFVTAGKYENNATPINVQYSDSKIKFGWLVSKDATAHTGELTFEIQAIGVNSKGDEYVWKTRPNGKLNILESLSGDGVIEPDESWITSFLTQVTEKVSEAHNAATQAQQSADQAAQSASEAKQSVEDVKQSVTDAKNELNASLDEKLTTALSAYYTSEKVDELLADIDLSEVYKKIDEIDGLAKFNVEYSASTSTLTFYNGEDKIKDIVLNTNPSAEWTAAYNQTVDTKITNAVNPVSEALNEYKNSNDQALKDLDDKIGDLPETLKTNYYQKSDIDDLLKDKASSSDVTKLSSTVNEVKQTADSNKSNITKVSEKIAEIQSQLDDIGTVENGKTYDATYVDSTFTLYEIKNEGEDNEERVAKSSFKILWSLH